jgi:hypothetical protein
MIKPYTDSTNIRTFSKDVDPIELVWHQDAEDRDIEILEGKGWQMQFDNELPFDIGKGDRIFITEGRSTPSTKR